MKHHWKLYFALFMGLAAFFLSVSLSRAEDFDKGYRFIFYAVLEGCYEDGLSTNDVSQILLKDKKATNLYSEDSFPQILRNRTQRPSEAERRRFHLLEEKRDSVAHTLGIDATIIAPRSVLGDLANDWEKNAANLMSWQRGLLQG
jgi:hypothetical protein